MKEIIEKKWINRENERGSALVMALLVSFLLLTVSAGLILESSTNTQNVTDAVGEQEAYHAAESGIQSAVHILRCQKNSNPGCDDVRPQPRVAPSASPTDPANQINYSRAVNPTVSNRQGDPVPYPRLSRWLDYSQQCGTAADCVPLNQPGYAYSLVLSDPDNTSSAVSFSMTGRIFDNDGIDPARKTYGLLLNTMTVKYTPPAAVANLDMTGGTVTANFGKFTISKTGTGAIVPTRNRFEILVSITRPFVVTKVIRGWILPTTTSDANYPRPNIVFDSQTLTVVGSSFRLDLAAAPSTGWSQIGPPPSPAVGYQARTDLSGNGPTDNVIGGTISPFEPIRLLLTSTGYGPRGAKKQLQAIIQKNYFNGLTAPSALTLVGPHHTDSPLSDFYFSAGSSNVLQYSGDDQQGTDYIPPIGASDPTNFRCIEDYLAGRSPFVDCVGSTPNSNFNGNIEGTPSNISAELPPWLQSPQALDAEVHRLAAVALPDRFFPSGAPVTSWGNATTAEGITFCDGDVELGQNTGNGTGGGILVVTGTLTLKGTFTFNGMIIVTGPGGVTRSGAGNGAINGTLIVAPYANPRIADVITPATDLPAGIWLAPRYDMSGGGGSNLQYNSGTVNGGLLGVSNFILGVMEK